MSHWIIFALDHDDGGAARAASYEAHKAYLTGPVPVRVLLSGPLLADDRSTMNGSFFLIEADERSAVEAFHAADPFRAAGVWRHVDIRAFLKRQDRR
jgi:hypothetical protein